MPDSLVNPEIFVEIQGEKRKIEFKLKNFAALKRIYGINESQLLNGLIKGEIEMIPYAIWCGTLKFVPFTIEDPLKIETQVDIKELFELNLTELKEITDKVILAVEAFLPKPTEAAKKKDRKKKNT